MKVQIDAHPMEVRISRAPIFIIGSPRSGTSVLATALGMHGDLWYSAHETNFVTVLYRQIDIDEVMARGEFWLDRFHVSRPELAASLGIGINALFTSRSGGKRWIEKTPTNTLIASTLAEVFPDAFFLHALRDGRFVVRSMLRFMDAIATETKEKWSRTGFRTSWAGDFQRGCTTWRNHVERSLDFESSHPHRCMTVRYERAVAEPEEELAAIFRFLQVPRVDGPAQLFRTHWVQPSLPPDSKDRTIDPWDEWTLDQQRIFVDVAGETMVRCGYFASAQLELLAHDLPSST